MSESLPVTVVMPAYNAGTTIAQALESVRTQTRAPRDVIVVDDGSTDDTVEIALSFGARVISVPNGGVANARNVGIRAARSPWIAFLDADDVWRPERLQATWAIRGLAADELIVMSDYAYLINGRVTVSSVLPTMRQYRTLRRVSIGEGCSRVTRADALAAIVWANFVLPSTLLVDRRLFDDFGVYFREREFLPDGAEEFFIGEDYEWMLRVLRHTDVLIVERPLVNYRRSETSLSANGGRLRFGDVKLGEIVRSVPEAYPDGAADAFARIYDDQLLHAGIRYISSGDVVRARAMFAHGVRDGVSLNRLLATAMVPFVTPLGRRLFELIHLSWGRFVKPVLVALRRLVR